MLLALTDVDTDAEYVLLHTESLAAIPESLDPAEAAPLLCAGVTCFNSIRNMGYKPGSLVAVQGIGGELRSITHAWQSPNVALSRSWSLGSAIRC